VTTQRDADYSEYVEFRLPALRRLALLLCQDRHRADDLVQQAVIRVYVHWAKASAADNTDACVNAILVREFLHERRSGKSQTAKAIAALRSRLDGEAAISTAGSQAPTPMRRRAGKGAPRA
jgi:DNA-directed RNA polymerase specialized sigma24 family protein